MLSYLWGGSAWTKQNENADPELAMREDLEAHGEFVCKLDGTMEFTDFLIVRSCIVRQVFISCLEKKLEHRRQQHELYLAKEWKEYARHLKKHTMFYQGKMQTFVLEACKWINYSVHDYRKTMLFVSSDPDMNQKMILRDRDVQNLVLRQRFPITIPREKVMECHFYKLQEEMKIWRKLQALNFTCSELSRNRQT